MIDRQEEGLDVHANERSNTPPIGIHVAKGRGLLAQHPVSRWKWFAYVFMLEHVLNGGSLLPTVFVDRPHRVYFFY